MTRSDAEAMYVAKFPSICRFVQRLGAGLELAEEVAQDSFVRILSLPNLDTRAISVSYWLRAAQTVYRRKRPKPSASCAGVPAPARAREDTNLPTMEILPPNEWAAVRCIASGMTYPETARALGVPVTTVNNWNNRGVCKLRKAVTFSQ